MAEFDCVSLWQPWASLLFVDNPELRKRSETRLTKLPRRLVGKRVAIHATLSTPKRLPEGLPDPHMLAAAAFGWAYKQSLPRGAVLGTLIFTDCLRAEEVQPMTEADRIAGDWRPGRFIWPAAAPVLLPSPIPTRGRQSWFKVELPS